jgi:hypothetical protein
LKIYKFKQIFTKTNKQNIELLQYKVVNKFLFVASLEEKNMAKITKFIYLIILFIFLLLVLTDIVSAGKPFFLSF